MKKSLFTLCKVCHLRLLFVFSSFFVGCVVHAQLIEKWVVNNAVSLPNASLPTIKDAVVIGADGNIVVSGKNTLTKLTPAGGQIWTTALTSFPAGYSADGMAIALDNSDNIYLTVIGSNINSNVFTGDEDIFVAKYSSAGIPQWSTWFDGPTGFRDQAAGIAVDEWGNVYVSGSSQINPPSPYSKIITLKYNTTGTLQWSVTYDDSENSFANAIAVDFYTGEVYVCGSSMVPDNYTDFTTIKYNTNGGQEWVKLVNGNAPYTQADEANAITVDLDGNVLVTGFLTSYYESSHGDQDARVYQTFKYDRLTGNQIWRKGYGSKQSEGDNYFHSIALAIVTDGDENVIVTGYSVLESDGSKEWATVKYRAVDGATLWVRRYNNAAYIPEDIFDDDNDVANSIAVDGANNVYVSGYSKSNAGGYDYVTIKYNPANGSDAGFARYDGGERDKPSDILVDWTGNVYVTGRSEGITTVKYSICSIICPQNISVFNTAGQCDATVTYPDATTSGNCGSLEYSQASGTVFPVGITTVTVSSVTTGEICSFTVTVVDNENPVITGFPANTTVGCAADIPSPDPGSVTVTDNCPNPVITHVGDVISNLTCANKFTVTRTYKVTDASGNYVTQSQIITVNDNQPPVISNASVSVTSLWPVDHQMKDIVLNYTITDNCTTPNTVITISSNEPVNGTGDGNTEPDWQLVDAHHLRLRAERSAGGNGRIYTITITSDDGCNGASTVTLQVVVAHNIKAPVTGSPFKIGSTVNLSGEFWDKPGNRHTAKWVVDNSAIVTGIVTEPLANQNGKVAGSYKFNAAGVYKLQMNITDQTGITSYANTNGDLDAIVVIYDPNGGYAFGGGWFPSQAGTLKANASATGKASYGFAVNYKNATKPKGETQFEFKVGAFEFNALNFEYLVVAGAKAQIRGTGKIIGGQSGINFIMTVTDGALDGSGIDKIRMKIFKSNGQVIYDNQPGASDADNPTTAVGANSIIFIQGTALRQSIITKSSEAVKEETRVESLEVIAYPNPSNKHFTLRVRSNDTKEKIVMQVFDQLGRSIEVRNNIISGSTVHFGDLYRPGSYYVRVLQDKQHKEIKLIKLSD